MLRILLANCGGIKGTGSKELLCRKDMVIPKNLSETFPNHPYDSVKITGLQWFFLRSKNPVYFAIHVHRIVSAEEFEGLVQWVLGQIPQLTSCYDRQTETLKFDDPDKRHQYAEYCEVRNLSEHWNKFLHELPLLFDALDGKMFRASCFVSKNETDGQHSKSGSLVVFSALHAVIEGIDLANLLRGKLEDGKSQRTFSTGFQKSWVQSVLYALTGTMIVASSHILARLRRRPAVIPTTQHINLERQALRKKAQEYGVSQKALLFAFARHSINVIESPTKSFGISKHVSVAFTEQARATQSQDDQAIKMRLRADLMPVNGEIRKLAERFDAIFLRKHKRPFYFQRVNNSAIRINRFLERVLPKLYGQKMFDYLPFSECYTLLPPSRFQSHLHDLSDGTIMTGSMSRGLDVITFCPGQEDIHIAFKTEPQREAIAQNCLDVLAEHGLPAERVALER